MHINQRFSCLKAIMLVLPGIIGLIPGPISQCVAQTSKSRAQGSIENRLRLLEDREEIRQLLLDYGRTLDRRDFEGFSRLFAEDAEYVPGGGMGSTRGATAIAKLLEEVFRKNPTGLRSPNFHLFANEIIQISGDKAIAVSKGLFIVPNETNAPEIAMLATYYDELVREKERWKFKKRVVQGDIPAPPKPN